MSSVEVVWMFSVDVKQSRLSMFYDVLELSKFKSMLAVLNSYQNVEFEIWNVNFEVLKWFLVP
jgi:hypothetical protein